MIPYVVAGAIAGLLLGARSKPKAKFRKLEIMGPETGLTYQVDVCPGNSVIMVHAADTIALFQKNPKGPGFLLLRPLQGRPDVVELMRRDLERKPKAPAEPEPGKVPAAAE